MPRFSANLGFLWADLPLLERIDRAAAVGFRAIELHWPYAVPATQVAVACAHHDLTLLGINTVTGDKTKGEAGLGALPGREREFQAAIDQSIAYCKASGATAIHAMAGVVSDDLKTAAYTTFLDNLKQAAHRADQEGLTLLLEPLNPRDQPGYFYSTIGEAAALINACECDNIRLMFDIYHVGVTEGDIITNLHRYQDLISHIQIASVPDRAEPDEGEIAYAAIFDAIDASGYDGWVGCEYKPRGNVEQGLQWMQTLGVAL